MKRIIILLLFVSLLFPAQGVSVAYAVNTADEDYYIRDFHVEVTANPDRSYDVAETIDVWFNEPSQGIDRYIPAWSWLERFSISDFWPVGESYLLEKEGLYHIGDTDALITGQKIYTIEYTLHYNADDDPGADYFFMNLVDTEWAVRIENFSARVTLPDQAGVLECTLTDGGAGGKEKEAGFADVRVLGNVIEIEGRQGLQKWDGVALNVKLPEGAFNGADEWAPPLEVEKLDITVDIDAYGVMSVEERYTAKINEALVFNRQISGFEGVRRSDIVKYKLGDGESPVLVSDLSIAPSDVGSLEVLYPDGRTTTGISVVDLYEYVGQTVDFSISYTLENRLRESMREVGFYLQLMKGYYTEMRVDRLDVSINAPFNISNFRLGDTMNEILAEPVIDGNRLTAQNIEPFENQDVSYVIEFEDAGFVRRPNTVDIALPVILLAAMLSVLYFALLHKREKPPVPVIGFYPPEGMNPAEAGYVIDERVSGRDVTSLIYYWASQGHLSIEIIDDKRYALHLLSELDEGHAGYEHDMFSALWNLGGGRGSVSGEELKGKFYPVVKATAGAVKKSFSGERGLYRKGRSPFVATSFLLMCLVFAAFTIMGQFVDYVAGVFPMRPLFGADKRFGEYENDFYIMFIFVLFTLLISMFLATNFYRSDRVLKSAAGTIRRIICLAFAIAGTIMFTLVCGDGKVLLTISAALSAASLYVIVNSLPFIARLSDFGVYARGLCLGFKMYLTAAEKQRFEMLLKQNPDYYYNILPYAQVLGVSKIWQRKFDRLITDPSSWLYGTGVDPAVNNGVNAMNDMMDKLRRNITSRRSRRR